MVQVLGELLCGRAEDMPDVILLSLTSGAHGCLREG